MIVENKFTYTPLKSSSKDELFCFELSALPTDYTKIIDSAFFLIFEERMIKYC